MPNWLANTLRIIIAVTLPLVLVVTNVRLMLTPLYINWEYNLKDFPPDMYGFTKEDRLKYAAIALDYLNNSAGIEFLGNLTIPDNQIANADSGNRMYNDRELKHMVDVKKVVQAVTMAWMISGVLLVGSVLALASGPDTRPLLRGALLIGAGITVGLLVALVTTLSLSFDTFFVQFHRVFFEGDSWLFRWTDTLIRLFPVKFWSDIFMVVGGGALLEGLAVGAVAQWWMKAK
ncbi:MAG: TIGR01906 family membrane protein [Chloroflexi bacterium]|nr:TIGR01906 family membrane protein [Chloroflexota bacterium]MBI5292111.1 TIGR01906 family membrane protein [Chloroflexota bacterium]